MLCYITSVTLSLSLFLSLLRGSVFPLPVRCGNVLQYVSDMSSICLTPLARAKMAMFRHSYLLGGYIPTFGGYYQGLVTVPFWEYWTSPEKVAI